MLVVAFAASVCCVRGAGYGFPEKITYATPDPHAAQQFIEKHFGVLRRVFDFESGSAAAQCSSIAWNTICHHAAEVQPPHGNDHWNWEWCVRAAGGASRARMASLPAPPHASAIRAGTSISCTRPGTRRAQ